MIGVNGTDGKNLSTNNILIDDWVFDRKICRPVRIAAVESNRVVLEGRPGYVSIDVLRPLEPTKEILKRLGFARDMDEWWYYNWGNRKRRPFAVISFMYMNFSTCSRFLGWN